MRGFGHVTRAALMALAWVGATPSAHATPPTPNPHQTPRRFFLPETTGSLKVGVRQLLFEDTSRDEPFTVQTSDRRRWVASIYYPAQVAPRAARALYMDSLSAIVWAKLRHLWQRFERSVITRAFRDAPVLPGTEQYPVVIYSPDIFSLPENYHSLVTDLASHGYVVVGINHTYASAAASFPKQGFVSDRIWANGYANKNTRQRAMTSYLPTWIADIRFVADDLVRRDEDPGFFLSGRLDVNKIGVWGHGYGGWAAARALLAEDRFVAGVALDGRVEDPAQIPMQMTKPWLQIVGKAEHEHAGMHFLGRYADVAELVVEGVNHVSFEDLALLRERFDRSTVAVRKKKPEVDPAHLINIIRAYVWAFFDHHLKGREPGLMALEQSPYSEAHLRRGNPAAP